MREPAFWWQPGTGGLLAPLGAVYGVVAWQRLQQAGAAAGVPVICLGNLTVGGAGKTPAALAVAHILLAAHERPFFLSRGYGGQLVGPVRVDPTYHHATGVGDEPLMLARLAPTIVARDRVAGAKTARLGGASVIIMDDGFQNPSLAKDLAIVLVDGRRGIGNGRIIPAGPLRAPLQAQLSRAHAVLVVGSPDGAKTVIETAQRLGVPILHGRLEPDRNSLAALGRRKVLAFAGIGNPDKFFATLSDAGIAIGAHESFPDHHRYTAAEASALIARAEAAHLVLVTTEKDHVRLAGDPGLARLAAQAQPLPVRLVVEEQEEFRRMVLGAAKRQAQRQLI
jgi:tetraacyldisaccharide 4'-kinase